MADIRNESKPIPGFEGRYTISEEGEVYSLISGRVLRQSLSAGYKVVSLYDTKRKKHVGFIHRLVAATYLGKPPGLQVRHLDGNKLNNHLSNLLWGTTTENQQDRLGHGTHNRGEKSGKVKLTEKEVLEIRRLLKSGMRVRQVARTIGCSSGAVSEIKFGRSWGWLS